MALVPLSVRFVQCFAAFLVRGHSNRLNNLYLERFRPGAATAAL
jgi:hypothetical protein